MKLLTLVACLLAFIVIALGAYTRLSDAGLGCPDWPGCYGQLLVPQNAEDLARAQHSFQQPVEQNKAWIEMIHRYCAGFLGLCILGLAFLSVKKKQKTGKLALLPFFIVVVVILQALLGMWTVTLQLSPPIILLHLFGGLTILSLLWWFFLAQNKIPVSLPSEIKLRPWIILGILLLIVQIGLGGWTSANYAALICPDFPYCQGEWLPRMSMIALLSQAPLDNTGLVTIHMAHRLGAILTGSYLLLLGVITLFRFQRILVKTNAFFILGLLLTQVTLGILNIVWLLPMKTALLHNMVAALLLLSLFTLLKITSVSHRIFFRP